MIVTIDGPAGSGKSTVARLVAKELSFRFLDTGAMYRAVALAVLRAGVPETEEDSVSEAIGTIEVTIQNDRVVLNGQDVSEEIRTPEVTAVASVVAAHGCVRSRLVELQRDVGSSGDLVTEGRDQGTVVFPDAEHKFFLTASVEARARRRHQELQRQGSSLSYETVRSQLRQRDRRDETRAYAPLKPAENAVIVDTSELTIAEVVSRLTTIIRS